jgi:hypothetical protein
MTPTTTAVFEAIKGLDVLTETMHSTRWIILDRPLRTALKTTRVLRVGYLVRVADGELVNCTDELWGTHVILALRNNIHNTAFEIDCEAIGGDELITIKL